LVLADQVVHQTQKILAQTAATLYLVLLLLRLAVVVEQLMLAQETLGAMVVQVVDHHIMVRDHLELLDKDLVVEYHLVLILQTLVAVVVAVVLAHKVVIHQQQTVRAQVVLV
jgi:hypothetical protein